MTFQPLGSISVGPRDLRVDVGEISLKAGDDTIWLYIQQANVSSPWPYSYGLFSWQSTDGRELGTVKAFGHSEGEVYRLGVGLSPLQRTGRLIFEPRPYNLRWLEAGKERWELQIGYSSGTVSSGNGGVGTFAGGFVNQAGVGLELARVVFP